MTTYVLKSFAAPRWSSQEIRILREVFMRGRDNDVPHNIIYEFLANKLGRSFRSIKYKLESMYKSDDILSDYKYDSWDREKIINMLVQLYENGHPINRLALPKRLRFQIANHSEPRSSTRGFETWFDEFDSAIAEAIAQVGYERNKDKNLDLEKPVHDIGAAKWYYRRKEKKTHAWRKEEIIRLFQMAHDAGLPLTHQFFAKHYDIYKPLLGVNRSLEGLKASLKLLGWTWGDAVIAAVPEYKQWYDESGNAYRSSGELRVQRYLDLHNIQYRIPNTNDRIKVTDPLLLERGYKNFIPDLFITDEFNNVLAIVEIFGSVADSEAADGTLADSYREKIDAKMITFQKLPVDFIPIHDNSIYGSDLDDDSLQQKFRRFIVENEEQD